jgi:outer membrane protein OmpA-like peptidoglycan-associated protein
MNRTLYHRRSSALFVVLSFACAILTPVSSRAQENSEVDRTQSNASDSGCLDLGILRRLPLSVIVSCHSEQSVEVAMPLNPDAQGYSRSKSVRGAYEFREYQLTQPGQGDRAFENLMMLLPISGFTIKYSSSPSTITARKDDVWVLINVNGEFYDVSAVKQDAWAPVKDAQGISQEMNARSRVAIYGIAFSSSNQTIVEQKSRILGEVLKYLNENPSLAVIVESHKVSPEGNEQGDEEITGKRAEVVVQWLVEHGIAADRLQSKALGRSKPISENSTPLEVRQNDRVELVKAPETPH